MYTERDRAILLHMSNVRPKVRLALQMTTGTKINLSNIPDWYVQPTNYSNFNSLYIYNYTNICGYISNINARISMHI